MTGMLFGGIMLRESCRLYFSSNYSVEAGVQNILRRIIIEAA